MDESQLYQTIGRLYAEILNASSVVDSKNQTIYELQAQISALNELLAVDKPEEKLEPEDDKLSTVSPPQLSNVSVG